MLNYNFDLRRTLCEATVDRAIRDIQRDTKRSLRNLVDLGLNFTANGRLFHSVLEAVRDLLSDEQSAYFETVQTVLQTVDTDTIKTFGLNMGLEGCTRGARKIRELEDAGGFNIPWALTICAGDDAVGLADCQRLVEQGTELGIFVYLLLDHGMNVEALRQLASANPRCAFVVLSRELCAQEENTAHLSDLHNVLFLIDADSPEKIPSLRNLRSARCLYGLYRWYDAATACDVTDDDALDAYREGGPVFLCLIPKPGTPTEVCGHVGGRTAALRKSRLYPYCPMELSGDLLAVDTAISDDGCSVAILPDGQISTLGRGNLSGPEFSIYHHGLEELLRRTAPKQQA